MAFRTPQKMPLVAQIVTQNDELASLAERVARDRRLTDRVRRRVPVALAPWISAADGGDTLVLTATSGAAASAIRQRVPDILDALKRDGLAFAAARVRVHVAAGLREPAKRVVARSIDAAGIAALESARASVGAGPLNEALERLARKARRGR